MGYFTTKGRLNRWRYFLQILLPSILGGIGIQMMGAGNAEAFGVGFFMSIFAGVIILFPAVRRLHDINASGWWYILTIVPAVNFVMGIALLFVKGTDGENRFGSDPLHSSEAQASQDTENHLSPTKVEEKAESSSAQEFDPDEHDKKCPMCAEYIKLEARRCKHCGHELSEKGVEQQVAGVRENIEEKMQEDEDEEMETASVKKDMTVLGIMVLVASGLAVLILFAVG